MHWGADATGLLSCPVHPLMVASQLLRALSTTLKKLASHRKAKASEGESPNGVKYMKFTWEVPERSARSFFPNWEERGQPQLSIEKTNHQGPPVKGPTRDSQRSCFPEGNSIWFAPKWGAAAVYLFKGGEQLLRTLPGRPASSRYKLPSHPLKPLKLTGQDCGKVQVRAITQPCSQSQALLVTSRMTQVNCLAPRNLSFLAHNMGLEYLFCRIAENHVIWRNSPANEIFSK